MIDWLFHDTPSLPNGPFILYVVLVYAWGYLIGRANA